MIRSDLAQKVNHAVCEVQGKGELPENLPRADITEPRSADHGDYATSFALEASKVAGMPPRKIAELLAEQLEEDAFGSVEIAGPGFLNFRLADSYLADWARVASEAKSLARIQTAEPKKILIEFVSVNPNGPIHLGHGRGAAFGDSLARCLQAAGHCVTKEYYVNDGVNSLQMQLFGESVKAQYRRLLGLKYEVPEDGYKGESVEELAERILETSGKGHAEDDIGFWQSLSQDLMLETQRRDLARFGVTFDNWYSEQSLHDTGKVDAAIDELRATGVIYEQDGALFLKSTDYGDDRDRCVVRSNGKPTYIASDIAYHKDKFERGNDHLIDIFGPDHHGYVQRTFAAVESMGYKRDRLDILITQMVRFIKDGKPAPMRKRNGEYYRLSDLMDELGADVVRFFYLMRSIDTHMDFDIDLAHEQNDKNPVFYAQYAHARICSLMSKAAAEGFTADAGKLDTLVEQAERELVKKIWDLPYNVERIASDYGVHRLTTYATELARQYHYFYDKCPVLKAPTREIAQARLALCEAAALALRETLDLLGVSAPQEM